MSDNTFLPAGSPLTSGEKKVLEGKLIEFLSKQPINTFVPYEKMTEIMGVDVKDINTGKSIWMKVRKTLIRDKIYYGVVHRKGIKRGANADVLKGVDQCSARIRNQAKSALKLLAIVDTKQLASDQIAEYNAKCASMGMLEHITTPATQAQVVQQFQTTQLDFNDTLEAYRITIKKKEE